MKLYTNNGNLPIISFDPDGGEYSCFGTDPDSHHYGLSEVHAGRITEVYVERLPSAGVDLFAVTTVSNTDEPLAEIDRFKKRDKAILAGAELASTLQLPLGIRC